MQPDNEKSNQPTLEEFRTINNKTLIQKGIQPPSPGSEREREMYEKWLRGHERIKQLTEQKNNGAE